MMFRELYQYFISHQRLDIPGLGSFNLKRASAISDFPNRVINAPYYTVLFTPVETVSPARNFYNHLASIMGSSDRDAVIRFNDFVYELKRRLSAGDTIAWDGIGTISRGLGGELHFQAAEPLRIEPPVKAEKVIRDIAEHTVRVGEEEKTSAQMRDFLSRTEKGRTSWWVIALIVGVLALMFLGWYFSENGINTSAVGNKNKVVPKENPATYKTLP